MTKSAKIEEFTYEYAGHIHKLYRVKIVTFKNFLNIFKHKSEFVIPFVFTDEKVAKDFLQYDIDYRPVRYKEEDIYDSIYKKLTTIYLDACEIAIKEFNNVKMLVTFLPLNTYTIFKNEDEQYVKFDNDIKIFKDIILIDQRYPTPLSINLCNSLARKNTYGLFLDISDIRNFKGEIRSYSSISDFIQYKNRFPEYFSNSKFNIDSNITNVKEFILQEV